MSGILIRFIVLCLLCLSTIADEACARLSSSEGPRILLIRHGEKDAKSKYGEVHLNQRGEIRAAALAELFFPNVTDSFCTETNLTLPLINSVVAQAATGRHPSRRKIETAEPIASAGSVPLELFDHEDIKGLVSHLREELKSNRTTLVVWDHSTISDLANDLLKIDRGTIRWPMDRYDIIWQIDLVQGALQQFCQHLLFGDLWCPLNPIQVFPITDAFRNSLRQRYSPILA